MSNQLTISGNLFFDQISKPLNEFTSLSGLHGIKLAVGFNVTLGFKSQLFTASGLGVMEMNKSIKQNSSMQVLFLSFCTFLGSFASCTRKQETGSNSRLSGNIVTRLAAKLSPPSANDLVIKCQKSHQFDAIYSNDLPWDLLLVRQQDTTYHGYLRKQYSTVNTNQGFPAVKIYKNIKPFERKISNELDRDFNRPHSYFSNGSVNNFGLRLFSGNHWNHLSHFYNGTLYDFEISSNPSIGRDVVCATDVKIASKFPTANEQVFLYQTEKQCDKNGRYLNILKKIPINLDVSNLSQIDGNSEHYFFSMSKPLHSAHSLKGMPIFNKDNEFLGFINYHFPDSPLPIQILSVFNRKFRITTFTWHPNPRDALLNHEKPVEFATLKYQESICKYLAKGLNPPGSLQPSTGWEGEWKRILPALKTQCSMP